MKEKIFLLLLLCVAPGFGCATPSQPNISALYRVPALSSQLPPVKSQPAAWQPLPAEVENLFQKLYALDAYLALEVGKLPEFQGKIGESQVQALTKFINLIANASQTEKANLAEFMKVGLPDVRRYCTPLQAIFWLLEKKDYNLEKRSPLRCNWPSSRMCLNDLLSEAWDFSEKDRWNDYTTVIERLNAPELVDYYERARFIYVFRPDHTGQPLWLFKTNRGQCADVTAFTIDCLRRAGYKAYDYHVPSPSGYQYHHVTLFEMGGREYIMDNGRPDKRGIIPRERYSPY